jgi:hypothetical protein
MADSESNKVLFYKKGEPYYEFSNFYPAEVGGYPTSEHYYQAHKYIYNSGNPNQDWLNLEYAALIGKQNTPNKAFRLARLQKGHRYPWEKVLNDIIVKYSETGIVVKGKKMTVKERPDWDDVKDLIMRRAVYDKMIEHPNIRSLLVDTGQKHLIENSPRDSYWGVGKSGKGCNMLGNILMETRFLFSGSLPKDLPAPTSYSNWVIPDYFLMAANPGRGEGDKAKKDPKEGHVVVADTRYIEKYLSSDIDTIISMQDEIRGNPYITNNKDWKADGTVSIKYHDFRVYKRNLKGKEQEVLLFNLPIVDRKVTEDNLIVELAKDVILLIGIGRRVMVHCQGGKGRAGTLATIVLGLLYELQGKDAIKLAQHVFDTREVRGRCPNIPQTRVQKTQVTRVLKSPEDILLELP